MGSLPTTSGRAALFQIILQPQQDMASKLARQMALKKRLEEEYKQANERLNDVAKIKTRKYHPMSFDFDSKPRYDPFSSEDQGSLRLSWMKMKIVTSLTM